MSEDLRLALVVIFATVVSALFSGAEVAILTADPASLRRRARGSRRREVAVERFLAGPQWFLAATLFGATLSLVAAATPVAVTMIEKSGWAGGLRAFLIVAPVFALFGRALPKMFCHARAERLAVPALMALRYAVRGFYPFLAPAVALGWALGKTLGRGRESGSLWYTRDQLKLLLTKPAGVIDREGRMMIDRVFDFHETVVEEAMLPLVELEAFEERITVGEALRKIVTNPHSRYPVYRDRIDNVIGTVDTVDLIDVDDHFAAISAWVAQVGYVPYSKPVDELLFEMQRDNFDFAVVVDEYGGCVGIVTREDIVEEIVGDIEDEHDEPVILVERLDSDRLRVNARMEIDDLGALLGTELPEGDYETVAGFLLTLFRRVPQTGERIRHGDWIFIIHDASPRAINSIEIEPAPDAKSES